MSGCVLEHNFLGIFFFFDTVLGWVQVLVSGSFPLRDKFLEIHSKRGILFLSKFEI